jgi:2-amino-4-hydroxy-6-hydroxymethyldihydropteridine diphosphokinase
MRTAHIGMGGNLPSKAGPPEATLAAAAVRLESLGRVVCRSSLYSTEPVGFAAQPRFVNAAIALETDLEPRALLDGLLKIEQEFGRDRASSFANGPRTLDLDILLFGALKISEPGLEIPHPRLAARAFVLVPLNEIAPEALDPSSEMTVSQLLHRLRESASLRKNAESKNAESENAETESAYSEGAHSGIDAVVQIQADGWRADPGRTSDGDVAGPGKP